MVIKNIGGKIVSFGNVMILPGDTAEVSEKFSGASNVDTLVKMGFIEIVEEPSAVEEAPVETVAPAEPTHVETAASAEHTPVKKRPAKAKVAE